MKDITHIAWAMYSAQVTPLYTERGQYFKYLAGTSAASVMNELGVKVWSGKQTRFWHANIRSMSFALVNAT